MFLEYKVRKLVNIGTDEKPTWKVGFFPKRLICNSKYAVERAKKESYNGKFTIAYSGGAK